MPTVTIPADATTLADILARVEAGDEVILTRGEISIAKITATPRPSGRRKFGALRGVISLGPEFFDPLPEAELAAWE